MIDFEIESLNPETGHPWSVGFIPSHLLSLTASLTGYLKRTTKLTFSNIALFGTKVLLAFWPSLSTLWPSYPGSSSHDVGLEDVLFNILKAVMARRDICWHKLFLIYLTFLVWNWDKTLIHVFYQLVNCPICHFD